MCPISTLLKKNYSVFLLNTEKQSIKSYNTKRNQLIQNDIHLGTSPTPPTSYYIKHYTTNHLFRLRWSRNKSHWHISAISPRQTPESQYQCLGWHPLYIWNAAIANRAYRTQLNGRESHIIPGEGTDEQTDQIC